MAERRLPIRPDLDRFEQEAKELLEAGEATSLDEARLTLARAYEAPSWNRLVEACELVDAIWRDDVAAVRALVTKNPALLTEEALIRKSNWGPPMSYAANLGRNGIIEMLYGL